MALSNNSIEQGDTPTTTPKRVSPAAKLAGISAISAALLSTGCGLEGKETPNQTSQPATTSTPIAPVVPAFLTPAETNQIATNKKKSEDNEVNIGGLDTRVKTLKNKPAAAANTPAAPEAIDFSQDEISNKTVQKKCEDSKNSPITVNHEGNYVYSAFDTCTKNDFGGTTMTKLGSIDCSSATKDTKVETNDIKVEDNNRIKTAKLQCTVDKEGNKNGIAVNLKTSKGRYTTEGSKAYPFSTFTGVKIDGTSAATIQVAKKTSGKGNVNPGNVVPPFVPPVVPGHIPPQPNKPGNSDNLQAQINENRATLQHHGVVITLNAAMNVDQYGKLAKLEQGQRDLDRILGGHVHAPGQTGQVGDAQVKHDMAVRRNRR